MEHDVGTRAGERPEEPLRIGDVGLVEGDAAPARGVEVLETAGREVVDDGHLVTTVEQGVDEVRPDEAGSAGDEGAHGRRTLVDHWRRKLGVRCASRVKNCRIRGAQGGSFGMMLRRP